MAGYTNNGTAVGVPTSQLPTGYTPIAVTAVTGFYKQLTIDVLKSVAAATATLTWAAIIADIDSQVDTYIQARFAVTDTVVYYTNLTAIRLNNRINENAYTDVADKYICTCDVYVEVTPAP